MELTRGQQEYLLELLSAEYTIPEPYRDSVKEAIKRYSSAQYSDDELDFLLSAPQSLAAVLLLNTTDSCRPLPATLPYGLTVSSTMRWMATA